MRTLLVLLLILSASLLPSAARAHGGTEVNVIGEVGADAPIQVEGKEFAPNDHVRLELKKAGVEPIGLGIVSADPEGAFAATLHVPATVEPGPYRLAAEGKQSASTEVSVGGSKNESRPAAKAEVENDRPTSETVGLSIFTVALAIAGAAVIRLSRKHPSGGSPEPTTDRTPVASR